LLVLALLSGLWLGQAGQGRHGVDLVRLLVAMACPVRRSSAHGAQPFACAVASRGLPELVARRQGGRAGTPFALQI
jgi:hypothetical protein